MKKQCVGVDAHIDPKQNVGADVSVRPPRETDNKNKGITLIALIVTIIVLLILASVSLNLISGNSGILGKAKKSKVETQLASILEDVEMVVSGESITYYTAENKEPTIGEYLVEKSKEEGFEGFEGRDSSKIYFESIKDGIVYITHEDKKGNKTYLTMELNGKNIQIIESVINGEVIDKMAPTLQITSTTTQSITFTATDRVGVAYYQITEENVEPTEWESVAPTTELEKTISDLENNKTYYIWVKDEAGNVRSKEAVTADFEAFLHQTSWEGTTATITVTSPQTGVKFKIGTSGEWTDYSETNKPSVPSRTEVFFQATDGKNTKQYTSVTPLWTGTVTYDANGGTGDVPDAIEVEHTKTVEIDFTQIPTKDGSVFLGWSKDNPEVEEPDYSENGTTQFTMGTEDVILYAVWKMPINSAAVAKDPKNYFGKTVNYTPPNEATSEWQIFYADAENIYLVTADYVPVSALPAGKNGTKMVASDSAYVPKNTTGAIVYSDYAGMSDISSTNPARKWMKMYTYSGTGKSHKALAYLLDIDAWRVFAREEAEYAIAGPPVELYAASYRCIFPGNYVELSCDNYGYRYRMSAKGGSYVATGSSSELSNYKNLYYISSDSKSKSWILASLNGHSTIYTNLMMSQNVGRLSTAGITLTNGFRPIVCLKKGAYLEEQKNGTFDVKISKSD